MRLGASAALPVCAAKGEKLERAGRDVPTSAQFASFCTVSTLIASVSPGAALLLHSFVSLFGTDRLTDGSSATWCCAVSPKPVSDTQGANISRSKVSC